MAERNDIQNLGIVGLISEIKKGIIRIPDFQRDYVWKVENIKDLLESVVKDYPLGSILLWKTQEKLEERDPLDLKLSEQHKNAEKLYLLDGQQRLVTLYSLLTKGYAETGKRKIKNYFFYDLKSKEFKVFSEQEISEKKPKIEEGLLAINKVFIFDQLYVSVSLDEDILTKMKADAKAIMTYNELHNKFNSIMFPAIISSKDLSVACRIFERLNNTGTQLTIADLMVATTYTADFNLRDKMEELNSSLAPHDFEIDERTILQCMSACIKNGTRRDDIIDSSNLFVQNWDKVTKSIRLSIDFLKNNCSVPVSKFLPNEIMLPVITKFFFGYGNKTLTSDYIKKIRKYFWISSLYQRYSSSSDTIAKGDIDTIDDILNGKRDNFNFDNLMKLEGDITKESILYEDMNLGSSFVKAILCFLASKKPKELKNNTEISLDQTFSEANLRQFHHIFPVNYLKKNMLAKKDKKYVELFKNSIANISLIPASTNRDIWDNAPSDYLTKFKIDNLELSSTLTTHVIGKTDEFGLDENDFKTFLEKRAELIANEIKTFISNL
ncbi:MAG: DUF262 domain-containing protein [Nanoarchaeota archaeon]|nr:DUF262 domain-containing protein [Nanoarchaeota archaeon]